MKVVVSHSGKQHSYHVAKALKDLGALQKFFTSSYVTSKRLQQVALAKNNTYFSRRFLTGLDGQYVDANWRFEIPEIIFRKILGKSVYIEDLVYNRDVKFDQYISKKLPSLDADVFWGFQGSCLHSLELAKISGKKTICELSTAHVTAAQKILGEERKLHPEWSDSIDNLQFPKEYEARLRSEPHGADIVIGASQFTVNSLLDDGIDIRKIKYLPLGFEIDHIPYLPHSKAYTKDRPLRLLYAGKITQRKGIKYLLEAVKAYSKDVELHLIGGVQGSGNALKNYKGLFVHHPPVSQHELFKLYQNFDVFVLPTLFEGFGLVILEAMAAGLPVITTANSIGPELIDHGKNGYIIPIRDVRAIQTALDHVLGLSEEALLQMKVEARSSAEKMDWCNYKKNLKLMMDTI
ncbi:MAG: glycosyltransferase family 4 protein [Bacteroidota bacterium]|nr:glycosyltransferase family 4 protein [Bacteroidota bacterium]